MSRNLGFLWFVLSIPNDQTLLWKCPRCAVLVSSANWSVYVRVGLPTWRPQFNKVLSWILKKITFFVKMIIHVRKNIFLVKKIIILIPCLKISSSTKFYLEFSNSKKGNTVLPFINSCDRILLVFSLMFHGNVIFSHQQGSMSFSLERTLLPFAIAIFYKSFSQFFMRLV